jgi:hypothetical protein
VHRRGSEIPFFNELRQSLNRRENVGRKVTLMRSIRSILVTCLVAACALCLCTGGAHAYLDPGTGSYLLQIVIAGLLGAAFTLKLFWKRLLLFFGRNPSKKTGRTEDDSTGDDG